MIGQSISHYKVTAKIGEGGMGEVYRATDSRLGRDVALKVIPQAFAADAQRMQRFQREAQVLASLNHPNIAAIYGLEQTGEGQTGMSAPRALVMELVEGPTLTERIAGSALPLDEALPIAKQIAEALEYAHERGIIHRDLKPANIKLTGTGQVKILDFGLAKALADEVTGGDVSTSPTLSMAATKAGIILGTASYMSPEQAKGKTVDRRADIWSFGVVLYEMLTGKQMYAGETVSETLAHVIMKEPELGALPAGVPQRIRQLLQRCFEKDPRRRLRDIGEARIVIEDVIANPGTGDSAIGMTAGSIAQPAKRQILPWAVAGALAVATLALVIFVAKLWNPPQRVLQAAIAAPEGTPFWLLGTQPAPVAVSPNGQMVTYGLLSSNRPMLYLQRLDSVEGQVLSGTEGAIYPFWSPDSRWIGFFSGGKLKKIEVSGGPPVTLCDAGNGKGGTWNRDGVIVFAPAHDSPLHQVSASGGASKAITVISKERKENSHRHPQFLPDGKHFLYLARMPTGDNGIRVGSLDGGEGKLLMNNRSAPQYASGQLLFVREGTLMAQPFDAGRQELSRDPTAVANNVLGLTSGAGRAVFSASENGVLVYAVGRTTGEDTYDLEWMDRQGKKIGKLGDKANYRGLAVSPDGQRAAVTVLDAVGIGDLWVYDVKRNLRTRLTFDPGSDSNPQWSPDGNSIVFASRRKGSEDLYVKSVTGLSAEELLYESPAVETPTNWSPDGKFVAFDVFDNGVASVWVLPLADRKPFAVVKSQFMNGDGQFSPDGKWLAYSSNESGQFEVYVVPFPQVTRKFQVSQNGGAFGRWNRNGKEIVYQTEEGKLIAVEIVARGDVFEVGAAKPLFDGPTSTDQLQIVPTADGQKFLAIGSGNQQPTRPLHLVVNWSALLKKN